MSGLSIRPRAEPHGMLDAALFAHSQESKEDGGLGQKLIANCVAVLCSPKETKEDGNKH